MKEKLTQLCETNQKNKHNNLIESEVTKEESVTVSQTKDPISLDESKYFINREISWIALNRRILEEAQDCKNPLLERLKFLAICGSNLDEFFMVRVSGLRRQIIRGALEIPADGMTPLEQITATRKEILNLIEEYNQCWNDILIPALAKENIVIKKVQELGKKQQTALRTFFKNQILPTLTPLAMDIAHPFPFISNLSINLAIIILDPKKGEKHARVKIPTSLFPRFIAVPEEQTNKEEVLQKSDTPPYLCYVLLEDLIAANLDLLFPGLTIQASYAFRVTRDAEIEISLDQAADLLTAIEESIETRRIGLPIRLEVEKTMPEKLRKLFMNNLGLNDDFVYQIGCPLALVDLWQLLRIDRPDLKDTPFLPYTPPELKEDKKILNALNQHDYLLYYPYDSFQVMVNFLQQAAIDPNVLTIKLTMYRIAKKSPIIDALMKARQCGKSVTVLVELKAKFDEENNINWARALEHAGVHVVYGLEDLKVHAKLCLVVKKEGEKIIRYAVIGTGNFNEVTSRIYADLAYFTTNPEITMEIAELFNSLTGYSQKEDYISLLVAPKTLRRELLRRIYREIECHQKTGKGYMALKMNGLIDPEMIKALYQASIAGVKIDLNVRGLCCLCPNLPGISETISQISIIGRFLEHARVYYFHNSGEDEVIIGSADMMPRNLNKRIEVLMTIPDPYIKKKLIEHILNVHLLDTVKARRLNPDGTEERVKTQNGIDPLNSQEWLINIRGVWHERGAKT